MKSSKEDLQKRGFIDQNFINQFINLNNKELLNLLNSNNPQKRTVAAFLIGKRKIKSAILPLCKKLEKEIKLYTKIEIQEALSNFGIDSVPELIKLLGKIGNNQHHKLPQKPFNKKNYPLPRDIAARAIIKIGNPALPYLEEIIIHGEIKQITEAIDAIGYISFYNNNNLQSLNAVKECLKKHDSNDIIKWKIIRAFQSFPTKDVIDYVEKVMETTTRKEFYWEAKRTLDQIKRRVITGASG